MSGGRPDELNLDLDASRQPYESVHGSHSQLGGYTQRSYVRNVSLASRPHTVVDSDDEDDDYKIEADPEDVGILNELNLIQKEINEGSRCSPSSGLKHKILPVEQAGLYLRDCLVGDHYDFEYDNAAIQWYKMYRSHRVRMLLRVACLVNIMLAFLQINRQDSDSRRVSDWSMLPLEMFCLSAFVFQSFLHFKFLRWKKFTRKKSVMVQFAATIIYFVDLFLLPMFWGQAPLFVAVVDHGVLFYLRFYIRPVYAFFYFSLLRDTIPNIVRSAKALIPVVVFLIILIFVFAIYGFMMFFNRNTYFKTLPMALYQMLITLTTANFPDVMVQGFSHPRIVTSTELDTYWSEEKQRFITNTSVEVTKPFSNTDTFTWNYFSYYLSPFYFIIFYLVGMYFLLSVAFAVVYNVYKDNLRRQVLNKYSYRLKMMGSAYKCLMNYVGDGTQPQSPVNCVRDTSTVQLKTMETLPTGDASPGAANGHTATAGAHDLGPTNSSLNKPFIGKRFNGEPPAESESSAKTGIDLYLFKLIYNELFPTKTKETSYSSEIQIGSVVSLLQDTYVCTSRSNLLPIGSTGVVTCLPNASTSEYEVNFQGSKYSAAPEEIILVEPAGHPNKMVRVFFHAMDLSSNGKLDDKEFRRFYQMLQLKVKIVRDARPFTEKFLPEYVFEANWFQAVLRFGRSKWLDRFIAIHIFGSVVLMAVHFSVIASDVHEGKVYLSPTWYHFMYAEVAVGVVFDLETALRIISLGWEDYWSKKWNKYDFVMSMLNLLIYVSLGVLAWYFYDWDKAMAMVMELQTNTSKKDESTPDLIMIVLLARLVRVVRIVSEHRDFRYILKTFANIVPIFSAYMCIVFIVYFYFVTFGMIFMHDAKVPFSTGYSQQDYYALNFDTFYSGCITMFCIMIVNNWFVVVDGFRGAFGNWVVGYFVIFWLITVILLMNVVTALVVEVWGSQWELNKEKALNIEHHPLAKRIHALNYLTPADGIDYYKLGLPPDPDGSRPRYKVSYKNYSQKVSLAMERLFLEETGFEHIILGTAQEVSEGASYAGDGAELASVGSDGGFGPVIHRSDAGSPPLIN